MGERKTREDSNPFTNGYVSDLDPRSLGGGFASKLENVIFTRNVAAKRGNPTDVGTDPFADPTYTVRSIRSAPEVDDPTQRMTLGVSSNGTNYYLVIYESSTGGFLMGEPGSSYRYIQGPFRGEWIICDANGVAPVLRVTAQRKGTTLIASGTISVSAGSTKVTGVGTAFQTYRTGMFIALNASDGSSLGGANFFYRIVSIDSNTVMHVEQPFTYSHTNIAFDIANWGHVGAFSQMSGPVAGGEVTMPASAPGTMTGSGTSFQTATARTEPLVPARDLVGDATPKDWEGVTNVSSVASDTSAGITGFTKAATDVPLLQVRPLVGKCAEFHNNRLFVANLRVAPNRLQWTTPGDPLEKHGNDVDSNLNVPRWLSAGYVEVPAPYADGEIVGLVSAANGGLIIGRSNSMFVLWGDPPGHHTQEISGGASCLDPRALFSSEHGVFAAGKTGVWHWPGSGGFRDITLRKINSEYREWADGYEAPRDDLVIFEESEHLVVAGVINGVSKCWAFWLGSDAMPCTGSYPELQIRDAHSTRFASRPPETLFAPLGRQQPATLRGVFEDNGQSDSGDFAIGKVLARTGEKIVGEEGDSTRLRRIRVAVDLQTPAGFTSTLEIRSGATDVPPATHKTISSNQALGVKVAIAKPNGQATAMAGVLGHRVREGFIELRETGDNARNLRIHSVVADARDKGKRV